MDITAPAIAQGRLIEAGSRSIARFPQRRLSDTLDFVPQPLSRQLAHVPRVEALAAALSIGVSVSLLVIKFVAYYFTSSAAIFSDALESIVNVIASLVAAYSLYLAHQPADESHPYGHGKVEFLSAAFEGGMILLAAMVIAWHALEALLRGPAVQKIDAGMILILIAGSINGAVGFMLLRIGASRQSATLTADGKHLLSDGVSSVVVLIGLLLVRLTGAAWIDALAAFLVAAYILLMGISLLRESTAGLMDQQDQADERLLKEILDAHVGACGIPARPPRICGYHKLRHRHSGRYHWVDFHITVPADWDVARGHQVASAIEHEMEQSIGEGNATAHVEPCTDAMCNACTADSADTPARSAGSDTSSQA